MSRKHLHTFIFAGLALMVIIYGIWSRREQTVTRSEFTMGTVVEITATGIAAEQAVENAYNEIHRIEQLTASNETSDIGQLNRWAGIKAVKVAPDTLRVLMYIKKYYRLLSGAFDPTIAPIIELWGFGYEDRPQLPKPEKIQQLLNLVNFDNVEINAREQTVLLTKPGMRLDLGGIAKGYAIDRAYKVLRDAGIKSALINGGSSSIRTLGQRADHQEWRIGIGHPRKSGSLLGRLTLPGDRALGTSADTQNFFIQAKVRYHHLINPHTGYPARDKILVTITAPTAMEADLLSTAFFILPVEEIRKVLPQLPEVRAILVDSQQKVINLNESRFEGETAGR